MPVPFVICGTGPVIVYMAASHLDGAPGLYKKGMYVAVIKGCFPRHGMSMSGNVSVQAGLAGITVYMAVIE